MKNIFTIVVFSLFLSFSATGQSLLGIEAGYGGYLFNSENDLTILQDHPVHTFYVLGLNYGFDINENWSLSMDYDFRSGGQDRVFQQTIFDQNGYPTDKTINYDYELLHHSFDLIMKTNSNSDWFSWGFGPSLVITNRKLGEGTNIYDKLASSALGICGTFEMKEPVKFNLDRMTYNFQAKMRYSHSVWFDEGIRKLDGYHQDFVSFQVGVKFLFRLD